MWLYYVYHSYLMHVKTWIWKTHLLTISHSWLRPDLFLSLNPYQGQWLAAYHFYYQTTLGDICVNTTETKSNLALVFIALWNMKENLDRMSSQPKIIYNHKHNVDELPFKNQNFSLVSEVKWESHNTKPLKNSDDDKSDFNKAKRLLLELPGTGRDYVPAIREYCGWGWRYKTRQEPFCIIKN